MWVIFEHRGLEKQLSRASVEIQQRYEKWKDIVQISGPGGLKEIRGLRDESLRGNWKGYRSSRLDRQYRVIYQVQGEHLMVQAVEVTPHDYRRKA